jgi:hypothetical protein
LGNTAVQAREIYGVKIGVDLVGKEAQHGLKGFCFTFVESVQLICSQITVKMGNTVLFVPFAHAINAIKQEGAKKVKN